VIGTSDGWGAEKPGSEFFQRLIQEAGSPAEQILYVGDRLDNDVKPAQQQGIATAFLRRGPWGYILQDQTVLDRCLFRLDSLAELPDLVAKHNAESA
jgi:FMN phosphatase YigB (HAD superfamily)